MERRDLPRALMLCFACALVAGSVLAFSPSLNADFVSWDDGLTITDNHRVRGLSPSHLGWMFTTSWAGHYQPLSWVSLALDFERSGLPLRASTFHQTNVLLHALGAVVLFALGLRLYRRGSPGGEGAWSGAEVVCAAALAAGIHSFHPLRCESVCWVTERRDVLSAPFFFLAIFCYLEQRRATVLGEVDFRFLTAGALAALAAIACVFAGVSFASANELTAIAPLWLVLAASWLIASAALVSRGVTPEGGGPRWLLPLLWMTLSLGAKAWALVLPAVFLLLDAWPLMRLGEPTGRLRRVAALVLEKAPVVVLTLVFARLAQWAQVAQQGTIDVWGVHSLAERVVQALYGIAFYPLITLWPVDLAPLYPLPASVSLAEPRFALAALATLSITLAALGCVRRWPGFLIGWASYIVIVSPVLGLAQSGPQLVADRYATLAGFPLACLLSAAVVLLARRRVWGPRLAAGVCAVSLVVLIHLSMQQSRIWSTSERLWEHTVASAPTSSLALLNLGLARGDRARNESDLARQTALFDEAIANVVKARKLHPTQGLYAINEAILRVDRASLGSAVPSGAELRKALDLAEQAIVSSEARGRRNGNWYWHHGRLLLVAGDRRSAIERFEIALSLRPHWPAATHSLASALLDQAANEESLAQALARTDRAGAVLLAPHAPQDDRAVWLRAGTWDLRWQLIRGLGRSAREIEDSRQLALEAWRALPGDHPRATAARARIEQIETTP